MMKNVRILLTIVTSFSVCGIHQKRIFLSGFSLITVPFAQEPDERYFSLCRAYPLPLLRGLPYVFTVLWEIFVVDSAPVSGSDGEIDVPSSGDGEGVAIFGSHHVVHLVPERATGLAAHVASSTDFEIIGEDLTVHPDMMPGEGFPSGCLSQPFAQGNISTVRAPLPMAAVVLPPAIHGAGGNRPSLAEVEFHSQVGNQ